MSLLVVGTVAFDAIETPFGKTDKIVGVAIVGRLSNKPDACYKQRSL